MATSNFRLVIRTLTTSPGRFLTSTTGPHLVTLSITVARCVRRSPHIERLSTRLLQATGPTKGATTYRANGVDTSAKRVQVTSTIPPSMRVQHTLKKLYTSYFHQASCSHSTVKGLPPPFPPLCHDPAPHKTTTGDEEDRRPETPNEPIPNHTNDSRPTVEDLDNSTHAFASVSSSPASHNRGSSAAATFHRRPSTEPQEGRLARKKH